MSVAKYALRSFRGFFCRQLLRCEVEGLRADLVHNEKCATAAVTTTMEQARDREQALQARMGVRLRTAEAEIAGLKRAMAEQKRCSEMCIPRVLFTLSVAMLKLWCRFSMMMRDRSLLDTVISR